MAESGEPSSKKKRVPDEHPPHMQFFKWAKMKYLSKDAVDILQSYCYGPNREVCDFMYHLMRYYHRQLAMENDYRAKLLQAGIEEVKPDAGSLTKAKDAVEAVEAQNDSKKSEKEEIEFLLEQKRVIEQELKDQIDGVEEDEVDEEEDDEEPAAPVEVPAKDRIQPGAAVAEPTPFPYNSPIPFDPLQSPRIMIKQEPLEEAAEQVPPVPTTVQPREVVPQELPRNVKREPFPHRSESVESAALSTVAVADEPLTTPMQRRKSVSFHPDGPSIRLFAQEVKNDAVAPKPVDQPQAAKAGQKIVGATTSNAGTPNRMKSAKLPQQYIVPPVAPSALVPVKSEPVPAPARAPEDPIKVAILSSNLVKLNQQIEYINDIRILARQQELESEIFYRTADHFGDPSPQFKLRTFKEMKKYASKQLEDTDATLANFTLPAIDHLRRTLSDVRTEIEGIWDRVCSAIKEHQDGVAAQQQLKQQQKQKARAARQHQQHPNSNKQRQKRQQQDHPAQPAAKRQKESTLGLAVAQFSAIDVASDAPTTSSWVPPPTSAKAPAAHWFDSSLVCAFCDAAHDPVKCDVYVTHAQREARRKELNLCYHCLRNFERFHLSRCPLKKKMCSHCNTHASHAAICRRLNKPIKPNQWAGNRETHQNEAVEGQFSPLTTPVYEEIVRTTVVTPQSPC